MDGRRDDAGDDARPAFAEFKLEGDRFAHGRLPVDALVELERYRSLLLAAARRAWVTDHPDAQVPDDFDREFDLAIRDVDEGSAVSVLERPESVYDAYFDFGRDTVDEVFAEIVKGIDPKALEGAPPRAGEPPLSDDLVEAIIDLGQLQSFRDLGSSLEPDEAAVFPKRDSGARVSMDVRIGTVRPLARKAREIVKHREHLETTIAGRLIALNAERKNYTIATLLYGNINGRYSEDWRTAELRSVLDSSSSAPVVRITGRMSWVRGRLEKILDVSSVELFEIESEPWSRRLIELASLRENWSDESDNSAVISFSALDAAREIIRATSAAQGAPFPGISPLENGGVHIQWMAVPSIASVEIGPDSDFYGHHLIVENLNSPEEVLHPRDVQTNDLGEIVAFIREAVAG